MNSLKFARFISAVFIPPIPMLIIFSILAFQLENKPSNILTVILTTLILGVILPVIFFVSLMKKKIIADQDANIKEQRSAPYLFCSGLFIIGFFILLKFNVSNTTVALWLCYLVSMLFLLIVNMFWKISAHLFGITCPVTMIILLYGIPALPIVILPILIGWSRIKLKCHSLSQVLAGASWGVLATLSFYYLKNYL